MSGLEVIDCTGVLIANTDIPAPEWVPTVVVAGTTPVQGLEHLMDHGR